jgi:outer membrane protein TolC
LGLYAQSSGIASILQQIEQNNKELKALASYMESQQLEMKSSNNLPDPQFGAYYLPFGEHGTGDYTEFQISQSFEFPTVYGARSSLIEEQGVQLKLNYEAKRQEILLSAQQYCMELIYLNKRMPIENSRIEQAKTVFDQVQALFDKDQVGILELNKAKVAWMQEQFKVQKIESDKRNLLSMLQNLNGGNTLSFDQEEYITPLELDNKDSLWQNKLSTDPLLQQLKQQETIAQQQLKLSRNKSLPNLTAGYNHQGVSGSNYSGIYAGVSIPLWSNRNKVKAAISNLQFQESYSTSQTMQEYTTFDKQYNDYQILLEKFKEYQITLLGLNSDELLLQAYQLGQISFMEYYLELQFYRQAYDAMLQMENQLHQLKADILKYQL